MQRDYLDEMADKETGEIGFEGEVYLLRQNRGVRLLPFQGVRRGEKTPDFTLELQSKDGRFFPFGAAWRKKNKKNSGEHLQILFEDPKELPVGLFYKAFPPQEGTDEPGRWGMKWDRPMRGRGPSNTDAGGFE